MIRAALRPCPVCRHGGVTPLHAIQFSLPEGSRLPRAYDVAACQRCAFVYADTPGTPADYEHHYAMHSRYEDPAVATGGGDAPADRLRIDAVADWIAARAPAACSVLDIGCGNGGLLEALGARGFRDLAGIDPAPGCVARLRFRGMRAWQGTLSRMPGAATGFGLIILSHVLEHVVDAREALRETHRHLGQDGLLYVETPDASRYLGRDFVPFYFFDSEHINHFDRESLAAVGGLEGYRVIEASEGELLLQGGQRYPVARMLLQRTDGGATPAPPVFARLEHAVRGYVEECLRRRPDQALETLVASGRPLALWGAGSQAQRLLVNPPLRGVSFIAVVDRDRKKQGTIFAGHRVQSPESGLRDLPPGTVVVVAAAVAADAILAEYRAAGHAYAIHVVT